MDISHIDINHIELFDACYLAAETIFETDPMSAPPRIQKKIRKWAVKGYVAHETYPDSVQNLIGKKVSDQEFIRFLNACHQHMLQKDAEKKQLFDAASAGLSADTKDAVCTLLQQAVFYGSIEVSNNNAVFDLEFGDSYRRTLTLHNASCIPEAFDCLYFENGSLVCRDGVYLLSGEAEKDDTLSPFSIRFSDASTEITLFRSDSDWADETPWKQLQSIAAAILDKTFLPGNYLNAAEKELLPLLAQISKLTYWARIPDEYTSDDFSLLKDYIQKYGYDESLCFFDKLEHAELTGRKRLHITEKLTATLNLQKYEPLWRELFQLLTASQAAYPSKAEQFSDSAALNTARGRIQSLMEAQGYRGTYPDFVKQGPLRGIRVAESYGMSYFIGSERNAVFHIHCSEGFINDRLSIRFLCGTECLRKGEAPGDIFSCLFNAKGRRLFRQVSYDNRILFGDMEPTDADLDKLVQIAVKKAELISLHKEERRSLQAFEVSYLGLFFSVFVIMGGLFGIFMTLSFLVLALLTCLIVGQPQTIGPMLTDMPWLLIFLSCWILYGVSMGIVTVIAKLK